MVVVVTKNGSKDGGELEWLILNCFRVYTHAHNKLDNSEMKIMLTHYNTILEVLTTDEQKN